MFVNGDQGVESLKAFINSVLKAAGSTETADDLFEFDTEKIDSYLDDLIRWYTDDPEMGGIDRLKQEHWLSEFIPDGISDVKIIPRVGVDAPEVNNQLHNIFRAEDISSEM